MAKKLNWIFGAMATTLMIAALSVQPQTANASPSDDAKCNAALRAMKSCRSGAECNDIFDKNKYACFETLLDAKKARITQLIEPLCESCYYNEDCAGLIKVRQDAVVTHVLITDKRTGKNVSCGDLASAMEVEMPNRVEDEAALTGYDWSPNLRDYTALYTQAQLDAELQKNKRFFDNLKPDSGMVETKRAQVYLMHVLASSLEKTGTFPHELMWDTTFFNQLLLTNALLAKKYDCKCPVYDANRRETGPDTNTLPGCKEANFVKACADSVALAKIRPKSAKYDEITSPDGENRTIRFVLNYMSDAAYIAGYHDTVTLTKEYIFMKAPSDNRYEYYLSEHDVDVHDRINSFPSSRFVTFKPGKYSYFELLKIADVWNTTETNFDPFVISRIFNKTEIETQELVDAELKIVNEMYPRLKAACKNSQSCQATALKHTLKLRDRVFTNISAALQPDILPQNDEVIKTEQFKKWFNEFPPALTEGYVVPTAAQITETKLKYIKDYWESTKDQAPKAAINDSGAEGAVKKEIESLNKKLKVKKVILEKDWVVKLDEHGIPTHEETEATVCIQNPDTKGQVLCSYYPIEISKPYQGGAKLIPTSVTRNINTGRDDIYYDYQGGGKFGKPEVTNRGADIRYTKYTTPAHYFIATNLK